MNMRHEIHLGGDMIYFIVNETAKTGKGINVWAKVKSILEEKQIKIEKTLPKNAILSFQSAATEQCSELQKLLRVIINRLSA